MWTRPAEPPPMRPSNGMGQSKIQLLPDKGPIYYIIDH
ncbi:hypothetical protein CHELA40_10611 [Chelatococcus asaccharovorans]|nr:hypothetical protein CHELA40_10611 [Chelatococcus asaccharovorans]CAH1686419.1 hypothetical protein CHELA17_64997 [Chelatococcus asaccharovorans]